MEIYFNTTNIRDFDETVIVVYSQKELNAIPYDIDCHIHVCFGSLFESAIVRNRSNQVVVISNDYDAVCENCASVIAKGDSRVVVRNCVVNAGERCRVVSHDSLVYSWNDTVIVCPDGDSSVIAYNNSTVITPHVDTVVTRDNARVSEYLIA